MDTYEQITHCINIAADNAIPKTTRKVEGKKFGQKPNWWDTECQQSTQARSRALGEYKNQPTLENYLHYKKMAARARTITGRKKNCFIDFCETLNRDTPLTTIWKTFRRFSNFMSPTHRHRTEDQRWVEDLLNSLTTPIIPQEQPLPIEQQNMAPSTELNSTEFDYVIKHKKDSSSGLDGITYSMLRNLTEEVKNKLNHFFNKILRVQESIPLEWKNQLIIPIHKHGKDPNIHSSYRPIMLSSCVAKTFESIIKLRMEHTLENKDIFNTLQNGFRKGRGTNDNIIALDTEIYTAFTSNKKTI